VSDTSAFARFRTRRQGSVLCPRAGVAGDLAHTRSMWSEQILSILRLKIPAGFARMCASRGQFMMESKAIPITAPRSTIALI